MNIAKLLARHLEFEGFGALDKSLFWGWLPDTPDTAACVYSHDSGIPGSDHCARLQIITRSQSVKDGYDLSQAIAESLDGYTGYLAGDGAHASITVVNATTGLGDDHMHRSLYSTNVTVYYCDAE